MNSQKNKLHKTKDNFIFLEISNDLLNGIIQSDFVTELYIFDIENETETLVTSLSELRPFIEYYTNSSWGIDMKISDCEVSKNDFKYDLVPVIEIGSVDDILNL